MATITGRAHPVTVTGQERLAARGGGPALGLAFAADGAGILLLAAADARSRSGASGGYLLFWAGVALIFLPSAWVLLLSQRSRETRLAVAQRDGRLGEQPLPGR